MNDPTRRSLPPDREASGPETGPLRRLGDDPVVRSYVVAITVLGVGLLGLLIARQGSELGRGPYGAAGFLLFSTFVIAAELFPISVQRDQEVEEITTSTTFAFALALSYGAAPAAVALAAGSIVSDVSRRKPVWKIVFNVAQYTLSIVAAAWVYARLGDGPLTSPDQLPALVASAGTFFVLNTVLPGIGVALSEGESLHRRIGRDFVFQAYTAPALLALSPIVLFAADYSLAFVPLLVVPIFAVYWGATKALENVRLVQRLQGNLQRMTELNRIKDDFVAVVSHELRTPLTSIQGYIKTLLQLGDDLDPEQRDTFLNAADRQGERLRRLIEQTLIVARLESHVEPIVVTEVSVPSLLSVIVQELEPVAHGHAFDLRVAPEVGTVRTDEGKVHQILSNLVENALKYSPPDTRVIVRAEEGVNGILVAVEDEGPGIDPEEQDRVFDRFYQVDQTATRKVGGTGLGLYICRKLAEEIGARLWLERSQPEGSVFCLFVPRTPPQRSGEDPLDEPGQSITASV